MTKLHADLQEHLRENKLIGTVLDHPLVRLFPFGMKYPKGFPYRDAASHANAMYSEKKAALIEARRKRDWHSYVFLHERPYCSVSPTTFDSICPIIPFALVKGRPRLNRFDKHDIDQWIKQLKGLNDNPKRSTYNILDRLDQ